MNTHGSTHLIHKTFALLLGFLIVGAATSAPADIVADYTLETAVGRSSTVNNVLDVSAGSFNTGPGWSDFFSTFGTGTRHLAVTYTNASTVPGVFTDVAAFDAATDAERQQAAVDLNHYWSFTLTPTGPVDFTVLSFQSAGSDNKPSWVFARSSVDSFATNLLFSVIPGDNNRNNPGAQFSADLTSFSGFSGAEDPIEFRIYGYTSDGGSNGAVRVDNVQVSAVPEPGTLALTGLALVSMLLSLLRRKG